MTERVVLAALFLSACAPGFKAVSPGMNAQQVSSAMGRKPARVNAFELGYESWYYNEHQCLLLRDHVVVRKGVSHEQGAVSVRGIGGFSTNQPAQCLPPGVTADPNVADPTLLRFGAQSG